MGLLNDEVLATANLIREKKDFKMRQVAVKSDFHGRGLGSKLMTFCEGYVRDQGSFSIYCHARETAVNFYKKNGWIAEGDYFEEVTIPHLKMRKVLVK